VDLAQIQDLIQRHGDAVYGFLFAMAGSNSLLMPLFGGYAAHLGALDWGRLVLVCWSGSLLGDAVRFWLGRRFGVKWLSFAPRLQRSVVTVARLIDGHFTWMVFVHRYPHGLRNLAGFAFGISAVPWRRFLLLNLVSGGVWAVLLVSIGYLFGHVLQEALGEGASRVGVLVLLGFLALTWILAKRLGAAAERH